MLDESRSFQNKVFFCDIIGYSRRSPAAQYECQLVLRNAVSLAIEQVGAVIDTSVIALPTGDGIALNFIPNEPDIHLRAAIATLAELGTPSDDPDRLQLRIGLNTHVDALSIDINGRRNIVGHGINIAQRVMDLGAAGQILLHDNIREDLQSIPAIASRLHFRGHFRVKHDVTLPISQYVDETAAYLNNAAPMQKEKSSGISPAFLSDVESILRSRIRKEVCTLRLRRSDHQYLHEIRQHLLDAVDEVLETKRLCLALTWIAAEMLDNAMRYSGENSEDEIGLQLGLTKRCIVVEVQQPDVPTFDIQDLLVRTSHIFSFIRLMHKRGVVWQQRRISGRLTVCAEIPLAFEIVPIIPFSDGLENAQARRVYSTNVHLPVNVDSFLHGQLDSCVENEIRLLRLPHGRIDMDTDHEMLRDLLETQARGCRALVVDLSRLEYISSAGLRVFMLLHRSKRAGVCETIAVSNLQPMVAEIFALSHFNLVFEIYADNEIAYTTLSERFN